MGLSGHADPSAVQGVTVSFTIVSVSAVLLRLYSRVVVVNSAGRDDVFIAVAALLTIGLTVAQCYQVEYGMGRHFDTLTPYEQITSLKPFWASIVIYNLALFFTKFSILLQYLRIFPYRKFRILCYCLMGFVFCWSCWTVFSSIFLCTPVAAFWDPSLLKTVPEAHCLSEWALWFSNAGVNIVTDILTAILPLPFLNQLQLPKRQRIALMIVFALGGFTCVISILRLESLLVFLHNPDVSWNNPLAAIWSSVEVNTGILCSCLPTLKALTSRIFPRIFATGYYNASGPRENTHTYGSGAGSRKTHRKNKISFDALGKGLSGRDQPTQSTFVRSGRSKEDGSCEEIEFATRGKTPEMEDGIQVVTVVEQEVEKKESPDNRSESELFPVPTVGRTARGYYEP